MTFTITDFLDHTWTDEWRLTYRCSGGETYTMILKLFQNCDYVEIVEESHLCHDCYWEFSLKDNLAPTSFWTHPGGRVKTPEGRRIPLDYASAHLRSYMGALTMPMLNISMDDDFQYAVFFNEPATSDAVGMLGIRGGQWDYPYENQIDIRITGEGDACLRGSMKGGHRHWVLGTADASDYRDTDPAFETPMGRLLTRYSTPLDKVNQYILDWQETPAETRPFLLADEEQLEHAGHVARDYPPSP